jgi:hypothetical protein
MPVDEDDSSIDDLALEASVALQEIQNRLGRKKSVSARVQFPRGYLRTAAENRNLLPNVGTALQRHNASYGLMMADVLRWLATRTDLGGPAMSMVVKETICIYGTISDWILKEMTYGNGSRKRYTYRSQKMVDLGIIDDELKVELDWIWEVRCNEHFHEVDGLEHARYSRADHNRAVRALGELVKKVKDHL